MVLKIENTKRATSVVPLNRQKKGNEISFTSEPALYAVKNVSNLKKIIPALAFAGSVTAFIGYLVGGLGLSYDVYKDHKGNWESILTRKKPDGGGKKEDGVKTVEANTKFGKIGIKFAKVGIAASSLAGIACGLGEGIPTMALGESTNVVASPIINTPIGTGLFGIGIASIFSGLALENTPEKKLNHYKLLAADTSAEKAKLIAKNMIGVGKEVSSSVGDIIQNSYKWSFWRDNFLKINPKTVVFSESINKNGEVFVSKMLRHNKNYLMHAASFTLGLGGLGMVLTSLFNQKKAQKVTLGVEEGGFLFDNLGMTKYGLDKLTNNGKSAGSSFAVGGIINAISQFMGIDNKDGRAMQWIGIALVFLGFSVDRGKHLKGELKFSKLRPELRDVVREWRLDLSKYFSKSELKQLTKEIKNNNAITNKTFANIESVITNAASGEYKSQEDILNALKESLGDKISSGFSSKNILDYNSTKDILKKCSVKMFGSENPTPV